MKTRQSTKQSKGRSTRLNKGKSTTKKGLKGGESGIVIFKYTCNHSVFTVYFRLPNRVFGVGVVTPNPPSQTCHGERIRKDETYTLIRSTGESEISHPHYGYPLDMGDIAVLITNGYCELGI